MTRPFPDTHWDDASSLEDDACTNRIGDLYMDGTIPEWAAEQLDELHRAVVTAERAEARRAVLAPIADALDLEGCNHARHNLDGAIIDLERMDVVAAEKICLRTLRRVRDQIAAVERALIEAPPGEDGTDAA
jgi:hypothetical protein